MVWIDYKYFTITKFLLISFYNLTIGPISPERLEKYDEVLLGILRRHKFIQFYVSNAVLDFKHHMTSENSREMTRKIPFFLNRFFTNRASARMLIHQYRKYIVERTKIKHGRRSLRFRTPFQVIFLEIKSKLRCIKPSLYLDSFTRKKNHIFCNCF